MASINFLVHRLGRFPITNERFKREKKTIGEIDECNDYFSNIVDKMIKK